MDALGKALAHASAITDTWTAATIRGMLHGYDARWRAAHDAIHVDHVETEWGSDLINLETLCSSRTFRLGGKVDKVGRSGPHEATATIWDHKTTSMEIADPASAYWRQLEVESQPSHYDLLLHANGVRVGRVVWDVAKKPTIKPKAVSKKDVAALASLGKYCGRTFDPSIAELGMRETPSMFEARVTQVVTTDPDKYFQRRGVKRTRQQLAEYAGELWAIGQEILTARRTGRWYRNSGACMNYGTPCKFLGICSGHDTPDSDRWTLKANVHEELDDGDDDGRNLLTNSRVRCFLTCRQKHYLEYEIGIKRLDEEQSEPLRFGSAWHDCLDVYWLALQEEAHDPDSREKPASEVV